MPPGAGGGGPLWLQWPLPAAAASASVPERCPVGSCSRRSTARLGKPMVSPATLQALIRGGEVQFRRARGCDQGSGAF